MPAHCCFAGHGTTSGVKISNEPVRRNQRVKTSLHWRGCGKIKGPFKRACSGGLLGDLRVIFLMAKSAPSEARFRPHSNLVNPVDPVIGCKRVKISFE